MSETSYMADLREKIGHDLLLIPGVAAIIRNDNGQILVQNRKEGGWNLPAGGIDPGEAAAQAIVREVREETGLIVRPVRLMGVIGAGKSHRITYDNGDVVEATTTIFACERVGGELHPQDDETAELKFFDPNEMPELPIPFPSEFFTDPNLAGYFDWNEDWLSEEQ